MIIIIDSKIFFYTAIQRHLPITNMFPFIIKEIQYLVHHMEQKEPISAIVFAGDLGKSLYRQELYPKYKGHRSYPDQHKDAQEHYIGAIPHIAEALDMIPMYIPHVEADDIAGILTNDILFNTSETVALLTNDHDWRQLVLKYPKVLLKSQKYNGIQTRKYIKEQEEVNDYFEFLLKKAMIGDISDNIKGLHYCGIACFRAFMEKLRLSEEYQRATSLDKFKMAVERLDSLPKQVKPHKYYDHQNDMSLEDALKLNFKLGEILTSSAKLTNDQQDHYRSYLQQLTSRVNQKKPIVPNLEKANKIIRDFMPYEVTDFGAPAVIPEAYGAILHLASKGISR